MERKEIYVTVETNTVQEKDQVQDNREISFYCEKLILKDKDEK